MLRQLEFINNLVADGRRDFSFDEAVATWNISPSAAANALRRLQEKGFVDRLAHGIYVVRPIGSLGTSAVAEDLPLAVGATFRDLSHRISYVTALSEHGLLSHPARTIHVACTRQVRFDRIGKRPLQVVIEKPSTIHLGAEKTGISWRSTIERALLECATRLDLVGGVERLAEGLAAAASETSPEVIHELAAALGPKGKAAERRLASLCEALQLPLELHPTLFSRRPIIRLDPGDNEIKWVDEHNRVAWNLNVDELRSVVD